MSALCQVVREIHHNCGHTNQSSSYDHVQFLYQLLSIVKRDAKGQRMLAFLCGKTAFSIWADQYLKRIYSFSNEHHLYNNLQCVELAYNFVLVQKGKQMNYISSTKMLLRAPLMLRQLSQRSSTQHRLQCICVHDPQKFKNSSNSIELNSAQLFCKNHLHSCTPGVNFCNFH